MACHHCTNPTCRYHRPRCKVMRKANPAHRACNCQEGFGYPHRPASTPLCVQHKAHDAFMWGQQAKAMG